MDRCALFVDANYVLAEGALAVHGTRNRDSVSWDYAGLLKLLGGLSRDRTGLPLLRCYWYDTVAEGGRGAEHDTLADVPGVKVRLSKMRPSRMEGVEAEIGKDLAALARNRAVSDAVIVSAEEDLAPVIAEIQDQGIRVVLLHISAEGNWAVKRVLRQESDDIIEMSAGHLRPFVDLIAGAEPASREAQPAIAAPVHQHYPSPVAPEYERAPHAQFTSAGRDQQPVGQDASRFAGQAAADEALAGRGPSLAAQAQSIVAQAQSMAIQGDSQRRATDDRPIEQSPQYQVRDGGRRASHAAPLGQSGYEQNGYGAERPQNVTGQGRPGSDMTADVGLDGRSPQHRASQNGLSSGGLQGFDASHNGAQQNGLPHNGIPGSGFQNGARTATPQQSGMPRGGYGQPANGHLAGLSQAGMPAGAMQPDPGAHGLHRGQGMANPREQTGQQGSGQTGHGPVPQHAAPVPGMQSGPDMHSAPGIHSAHGVAPGQGLPHGQGMEQNAAMQPGQHGLRPVHGGPAQQNGLAPLDPQRGQLPQRQLPAANGLTYPPDRNVQYGQPGQYAAPPQGGGYGQPSYGEAQPAMQVPQPPPPVAISVGEAVQSAHAEGFGFGEAVARDAPALWLEAVLARKPRMPSDLEARLLQGSALPIDSLLHDEVRHALRRGFWDALERSRH